MTLKMDTIPARGPFNGLRLVKITGALSLLLYVAYYLLFQAHAIWQSPTLVPDKWKGLFSPLTNLFPEGWTRAPRFSVAALADSMLYLVVLALLFAV